MKKLIVMILALAMVFSLAGCGCDHQWAEATCTAPKTYTRCGETEGAALTHTSGELKVVSVDTENLTITQELSCARCGTVLETKEVSTGIAPLDGKMQLSPSEWFTCLTTNIYQYGANQTLLAFPVESEDDALVLAVMTLNDMKAVFTFRDAEGNILTAEQDQRNLANSICLEAQFTNATASEFYQLLMLVVLTNNSDMDPATANELAGKIMGFETVSSNGYAYNLQIVSKETHTVALTITTE